MRNGPTAIPTKEAMLAENRYVGLSSFRRCCGKEILATDSDKLLELCIVERLKQAQSNQAVMLPDDLAGQLPAGLDLKMNAFTNDEAVRRKVADATPLQ